MPCNDITDIVQIRLDENDRVTDYALNKRTCGGTVGEDKLIGPWLFRRTAGQVVETTLEQFLGKLRTTSDLKEYLALKHFLAVRTALEIAAGRESGGLRDHCTLESIEYGPEGIEILAHLDVKALTGEIESCKNCCGSKTDRFPA